MKKHVFFSAMTSLTVVATLMLTSCEKGEAVIPAQFTPATPDALHAPYGFDMSFHTYEAGLQR